MKQNTLVIMAAGLGSRYGGIKQLEPVGPSGEIIMDYSIYDAIQAGFQKVVFIIRKDIEEDFKEIIGNRISKIIDTEYVLQDINDLPEGYEVPEGRTKPWGTGQAILCCKDLVDGPFAVINADDYYGKDAFVKINEFLKNPEVVVGKYSFCMAGFILGNTLSDNGSVTRGICTVNAYDVLVDVKETSGIRPEGDIAVAIGCDGREYEVNLDDVVSMNMWGFTKEIFKELEEGFPKFLDKLGENRLKAEYLLPVIVDGLIKDDKAQVKVLRTDDKWVGVTYKEDKKVVVETIMGYVKDGIYPMALYNYKETGM
ncbi:nucleotidyltransferase family protein [Anaeromicropila herbilytica]|uniref:Nucleotidyltransferase n=1 Tax=Anaeromicropila herbilytica TaxID=2785025 RepID=A0A7R7EPA9_9FIRM|nr:nucleotidyltransferase [Anaeromicropila herbilytica]BCN32210.1 nucleotidyltransferase [Anaeromicropila herbilytica]